MLKDMNFKGNWRDYQARALEEMGEYFGDRRLHIVAAPGAGKTVLGLEIVQRIGRSAIVFAPSIAIREQWEQRLCPLFLDATPAAGSISRDLSEIRSLTLTTYQALDSVRRGADLESLIQQINKFGPVTLVFDEAHHLRREWWKCLNQLANRLQDVRIVALTATPPYDASFVEWSRYEELCGTIDLEIGIPELVRNGDLCAHQDHLILSEPTEDALQLLEKRSSALGDLASELRADEGLLDWLAAHPWLTDPEANVEEILDAPEMLSAVLVLLASAGRSLPRPALKLLGVSASHVPPPSVFWLERFLDGILVRQAASFPLDPPRLKGLKDRLHRHGLIAGGRVRLQHTRSVFRLMSSSLAKLDSIAAIARAEANALGDDLRMVVLSDHIRAEELLHKPNMEFRPAKLGVIPIFEILRRTATDQDHLAVLTGSLVIIPREALTGLREIADEMNIDIAALVSSDLPGCPYHVRVNFRADSSASLVRLVTALFTRGYIRILVGTQSLLGEGWDAPVLNSLVLASNTASFMLSNQMRGRAIRIDPAKPDKVSNIWHLATVDPADRQGWESVVSTFNWGAFNDRDSAGVSDLQVVARRFKAFAGISNGTSTVIEDGVARLGLDPTKPVAVANLQTFGVAADRTAIADRWKVSLGQGKAHARVRETAAIRHAPRALSMFDTLQALTWSAASSGAFAAANELRSMPAFADIGLISMGLAGVATLASIPKLAKAGKLFWRNGSLEGSLREVVWVAMRALADADVINGRELDNVVIEICSSLDGRKDIVLTGVRRATERLVMQAIAEILGPVQNPRYILVRISWFGLKRRVDYHAVPAILGARKELAEQFALLWQDNVGSSKLVFTRTQEGRRVLLRARASSFASGFQRTVDRRSVWL